MITEAFIADLRFEPNWLGDRECRGRDIEGGKGERTVTPDHHCIDTMKSQQRINFFGQVKVSRD